MAAVPATAMHCVWLRPAFDPTVLIIISLLVVLISCPVYTITNHLLSILNATTPMDLAQQEKQAKVLHEKAKLQLRVADKGDNDSTYLDYLENSKNQAHRTFLRSTKINPNLHTKLVQIQTHEMGFHKLNSKNFKSEFSNPETLLSELSEYAATLDDKDFEDFSLQWGVLCSSVRAGVKSKHSRRKQQRIQMRCIDALSIEMQSILEKTRKQIQVLMEFPERHRGLRILQLFVLDLIGRDSRQAKIFENQLENFESELLVTWGVKCLCASALIVLNLFLIFTCMLYGRRQGMVWQRGWLIASMVNLLLDITVKQVGIVNAYVLLLLLLLFLLLLLLLLLQLQLILL